MHSAALTPRNDGTRHEAQHAPASVCLHTQIIVSKHSDSAYATFNTFEAFNLSIKALVLTALFYKRHHHQVSRTTRIRHSTSANRTQHVCTALGTAPCTTLKTLRLCTVYAYAAVGRLTQDTSSMHTRHTRHSAQVRRLHTPHRPSQPMLMCVCCAGHEREADGRLRGEDVQCGSISGLDPKYLEYIRL